MPQGFYSHTFSTTYDWKTKPNWNHRHYPALAKIIEQAAKQFSMDYHCIEAKELFIYQQCFLREMGLGKQTD